MSVRVFLVQGNCSSFKIPKDSFAHPTELNIKLIQKYIVQQTNNVIVIVYLNYKFKHFLAREAIGSYLRAIS